MKPLQITYDHALISKQQINDAASPLLSYTRQISQALKSSYETDYAPLYLPEDNILLASVEAVIENKKSLNSSMCILIAIGGSNLGTLAIFDALKGLLYNQLEPAMRFYYVDTIDTQLIKAVLALAEAELQKKKPIIVNIVTKSGETTETLINAAFFIELIKKYYPRDYQKFVVVTTDKNSPAWLTAQQNGYAVLEVPQKVGGRYSVLSAVGLFPLGLFGINIRELRAGALEMRDACLSDCLTENIALISALIVFLQYQAGKNIHDTFIFKPALAQLGFWYRQLVGESLGKKERGITPTVSVGTTDLHSVAQLYLAGPFDKLTTFIYVRDQEQDLRVPANDLLTPVPFVARKSVESIKKDIFSGVQDAYQKQKRPFITVLFNELTAYSLGQFLMFKMCEVIYTARLLDVNFFDQPAVELYKSSARKLLKNE